MATKKQVEKIIKKYQPILKLNSWIIKVDIVNKKTLHQLYNESKKETEVYGAAFIKGSEHLINMYIWEKAEKNTINLSLEAIVVHEMVHAITGSLQEAIIILLDKIIDKSVIDTVLYFVNRDIERIVDWITRIVLENNGDSFMAKTDNNLENISKKTSKSSKKTINFEFDFNEPDKDEPDTNE
jgi:hypothetical protein